MGQPKTTIELNGKLYDASTGAMVQAPTTTTSTPMPKQGASMDGFFRPPRQPATKKTSPRANTKPQAAPRKPQHAQTLMRHVVKKPAVTPAPATTESSSNAKTKAPSLPTTQLTERQERAQKVAKSSSISRFGTGNKAQASVDKPLEKKVEHLAVKPHPSAPSPVEPPIHAAAPAAHQPSSSEASFNKALETAQSHQQSRPKPQKIHHRAAKKLGVSSRALNIASISLVIVLLFGFVAYQNAPNVSMYLAGNRAGFQGNLPGYTPNGFGLSGPINATPGAITVNFRSHTDNRSYAVSQEPSNWTSDSLRYNFFKSTDSPVALPDKGKTIYFYNGGSSAIWVNAGVLYKVTGNAGLSSDQIVSIADSL